MGSICKIPVLKHTSGDCVTNLLKRRRIQLTVLIWSELTIEHMNIIDRFFDHRTTLYRVESVKFYDVLKNFFVTGFKPTTVWNGENGGLHLWAFLAGFVCTLSIWAKSAKSVFIVRLTQMLKWAKLTSKVGFS